MTTDKQYIGLAKVKPNWDFWGLIDTDGNYVLEPIYNEIHGWKGGIARLEKISTKNDVSGNWTNHYNGQYGFINANGKMITDFSFEYANDFCNGFASVNKDKKWGFIDENGQLVIPFQFDDVHPFYNGQCNVCIDNKWGVIDKNGKWKLENRFESLSGFAFGLAVATAPSELFFKQRHKFIIDSTGNKIVDIPPEWPYASPISKKLILLTKGSNYPGGSVLYSFMDLQGNIKPNPEFYGMTEFLCFKNGKLWVKTKDGKDGFINEEGEFIHSESSPTELLKENVEIPLRPFDEVLPFSEGLAVARQDNLWGVINENNEIVIEFKYQKQNIRTEGNTGLFLADYSPKFSCGLIGIYEERDTIYSGYMDKEGKTAIELKFRITTAFCSNKEMHDNGKY